MSCQLQCELQKHDVLVPPSEHASHPSELRADGVGLFLSECCKGVSHGLHSKAAPVLELAFNPDLLCSSRLAQVQYSV